MGMVIIEVARGVLILSVDPVLVIRLQTLAFGELSKDDLKDMVFYPLFVVEVLDG